MSEDEEAVAFGIMVKVSEQEFHECRALLDTVAPLCMVPQRLSVMFILFLAEAFLELLYTCAYVKPSMNE